MFTEALQIRASISLQETRLSAASRIQEPQSPERGGGWRSVHKHSASAVARAKPERGEAGGRGGTEGPASSSIAEDDRERAGGGVLACRAWIISCIATRSSTWERVTGVLAARSAAIHASKSNGASSGTFERGRDCCEGRGGRAPVEASAEDSEGGCPDMGRGQRG